MDAGYVTTPLIFLIQVLFGFYTLMLMLRFLLQLVRADFRNPVSQFVLTLTTPVLKPLRRYIPGYQGLDLSSLLVAWLVKSVEIALILLLSGASNIAAAFVWAIPALVSLLFTIFTFSIIIEVLLSWFQAGYGHPLAGVVHSLNAPIMRQARRFVPAISGIDLAPMAAILGLMVLKMLAMPLLSQLFGMPSGLF
ncbi:MAG: YggT family protein [Pseudomonadota bacterium]